jgi:hypothetical protein
LLGNFLGHGYGDGEFNSDVATCRTKDRSIDSDELTIDINQRPSGVAAVYRCINLNEVIKPFDAQPAAT